jgi:hypothetical protein
LIAIAAVSTLVVGTARAVFNDSSVFGSNTITTAKVEIDTRSEPMGRLPKPLNVSGLVPTQWTNWARGIVFNTANSTNIRLYMYLDNINGTACDKTNLQVYTGHANNGNDSERGWVLMNGLLSSYSGAGNRVEITGKVFNPTMPTNNSAVLQQRAQLDGTAGDIYQGTSCTWDEVFVAETPTYQ